MKTLGVLLAAGASRRFGAEDKLLASWRGEPLVVAAARTLARAGCDELAAVVSSGAVAAALPPAFPAIHIEPGLNMSASLRAACRFAGARDVDRMLIALGDMPALRVETLRKLLTSAHQSRACHVDGTRMPPVVLLRQDWRKAALEQGDQGARSVIAALPASALLALSCDEARDIDRVRDLEKP